MLLCKCLDVVTKWQKGNERNRETIRDSNEWTAARKLHCQVEFCSEKEDIIVNASINKNVTVLTVLFYVYHNNNNGCCCQRSIWRPCDGRQTVYLTQFHLAMCTSPATLYCVCPFSYSFGRSFVCLLSRVLPSSQTLCFATELTSIPEIIANIQ